MKIHLNIIFLFLQPYLYKTEENHIHISAVNFASPGRRYAADL